MVRKTVRRRSTTSRTTRKTTRKPARRKTTTRAASARTRKRTTTTRSRTTARTTAKKPARRVAAGASQRIESVMTRDPVALLETETLTEAARLMKQRDIGDVIVLDDTNGRVKGIVTDRDIVIRALADGRNPMETTLASVTGGEVFCLTPTDTLDKAVKIMRDCAVRRLPVVEGEGQPVGIVSIGDLAQQLDRKSALADISAAPANE